jgi:Carboxypeptidase regulatory-like domain
MVGDERVRHCSECDRNVYNFSAMSGREIEQLLIATEGRLCARWYRRVDGRVLTQDCPVGFRRKLRRVSLIAGTALSALLGAAAATAETSAQASSSLVTIQTPQPNVGEVAVEVVDTSGALIPKAKVSILNGKSRVIVAGETDERGRFNVRGLSTGSYLVQVSAIGFKTETRGVAVQSGSDTRASVSVQMELGVAVMGEVVVVPAMSLEPREPHLPDVLPVASPHTASLQGGRIRRFFSKVYEAVK